MSNPSTGKRPSARSEAEIALAVEQLGESSRGRAVEIADEVLLRTLRSSQRSLPIRAQASWSFVHISDRVLITALRAAIDSTLRGVAVGKVHLNVDRDETLTSLTIELFVQFGLVLVDVGDGARRICEQVLHDILAHDRVPVRVTTTHVHISDVTAGDPLLVDPMDDRS